MLRKADTSAIWAVAASLGLFFIGGILTTVVPIVLALAQQVLVNP